MIRYLIVAVPGVFLAVIGFVAMVKLLQIAEDLRYMRSRNDSSVKKPRKYTETLLICLAVSVVLVFAVLMGAFSAFSSASTGNSTVLPSVSSSF